MELPVPLHVNPRQTPYIATLLIRKPIPPPGKWMAPSSLWLSPTCSMLRFEISQCRSR